MELDDEILEKLRCGVCKNYLSYGPIKFGNSMSVCGRCCDSNEEWSRNDPYETLAGLVKFPCRYREKGCVETLDLIGMPKHENTCSFKTILCPASSACEWRGRLKQLQSHYEDEHQNMLVGNPCEFKPVAGRDEWNFVLVWEEFTFLMKIAVGGKKMVHTMDLIGGSSSVLQFVLEIGNEQACLRRKSRRMHDRFVIETNVNHLESVGEYESLNFRVTCEKVASEAREDDEL